MREGPSLSSRGHFICAWATVREVVHGAKCVSKCDSAARIDDREGLGLYGSGERPLYLLRHNESFRHEMQ